jgi:hypothetical protein
MNRPTQDEICVAYKAMESTRDTFERMCREVVYGTHRHTRDELRAAAECSVEAHHAFRRKMAPCCGYGPTIA